jgi:hypothetical protein
MSPTERTNLELTEQTQEQKDNLAIQNEFKRLLGKSSSLFWF